MQELEGDVKNAVHTATLNVQTKFDKKLRKQRKQDEQKFDQRVIDKANEKNASINLELAQKREENKNLLSKIDDLNRGSKNVSQEEKGEAGENYAQDLVKKLFPMDQVSEVKKGQRGADIIHTLINSFGPIGKILIESKNTQSFQKSWIEL